MSKPAGRKLNVLEQKLHQTALADPSKMITLQDISLLAPDATARTAALNFLLGTGMFKAMKDAKAFRVVTKDELTVTKGMGGEDQMVLSHIKAAGNEGIWSKHLKAKTDLHQTVIDRILKGLVQKQLVKTVKNVKFPTRKIYMMFDLEPSVELTGGPWYTDNELDTEFIKLLSTACLRFIRDRSLPKQKTSSFVLSTQQPLYPISNSPDYPTAVQIQQFLSKSKITETRLDVEHVEMLLKVLILDGEIEKIPSFGAAIWEANAITTGDDNNRDRKKRKKPSNKKHYNSDSSDDEGSRRHRKKKKHLKKRKDMDSSDLDGSDYVDEKSKSRLKSRKWLEDSDEGDSDREGANKRKGKNKRKHRDGSDEGRSDEGRKRSRSRSKLNGSRRHSSSDSESSEDEIDRRLTRSHQRSPSPAAVDNPMAEFDADFAGMHAYRAIKQERLTLGWSQAPCGRCPQFDFCHDKGPVNAEECEYFGEWLGVPLVMVD